MMSRHGATITGVLVTGPSVMGDFAETRSIAVGPSAAPDTTAANALTSPQGGEDPFNRH